MADPRDVEKVAVSIRDYAQRAGVPLDAEDVTAIAKIALSAVQDLPQRAKEVRATRNG